MKVGQYRECTYMSHFNRQILEHNEVYTPFESCRDRVHKMLSRHGKCILHCDERALTAAVIIYHRNDGDQAFVERGVDYVCFWHHLSLLYTIARTYRIGKQSLIRLPQTRLSLSISTSSETSRFSFRHKYFAAGPSFTANVGAGIDIELQWSCYMLSWVGVLLIPCCGVRSV